MNKPILALLLVCLGLDSGLNAANLLRNGGFEEDSHGQNRSFPGWTWYGQEWGNTFNETGAEARGGQRYCKVFQGFTHSVNYSGVYQDYISGPGAAYEALGWARIPAADALAGQNEAWLEVSFRDARARVLAMHRSGVITTNVLSSPQFSKDAWLRLAITNQCDPQTGAVTGTSSKLVAPPGTCFVRYQVVLQGDAAGSRGSVYFDDLELTPAGGSPYDGWNVVWRDEFNGSALDTNKWTFDLGNRDGWGNNEFEYYTDQTPNVRVADGLLHIAARQQATNGFRYTSARLKTEGKASWRYGRFEWRAKFPAGTGFWPAIWFLGTNITSVGWPGCGEIDVVENNGAALAKVQGSLHSGGDTTAFYNFPPGEDASGFHDYALDWTGNAFLYYVDGHLYQTQTNWSSSLGLAYPGPFDRPCFMLLNLAVGGNYLGNPTPADINANGGFPGEMLVDYVRVYAPAAPEKLQAATPARPVAAHSP